MKAISENKRLNYLDGVRAFALLLGIVFHASLSFMPKFIGWAVMDVSTSNIVSSFVAISHSFRMELFFLIAGFFSHLAFHSKGTVTFLKSRLTRILIPFLIGWFILSPLTISGWIMGAASLRGEVNIIAGLQGGFASLANLPNGLLVGTHLWFLHYLTLVTLIVLCIRWAGTLIGSKYQKTIELADRAFNYLAQSRMALFTLAAITCLPLWYMSHWGVDTPSTSLIPDLQVTALYTGCFLVGWMLHRNQQVITSLTRLGVIRFIDLAGATLGTLWLLKFESDFGHPHYHLYHAAFVFCYAMMMWSLVFISIGLFRRFFNKPNAVVRYFADASYWLYLVHLPIVVWLQIAFAELPLHWGIKLVSIFSITVAVSLLMYDCFVRSTFIGATLNGRRKERELFRSRVTKNENLLTKDKAGAPTHA